MVRRAAKPDPAIRKAIRQAASVATPGYATRAVLQETPDREVKTVTRVYRVISRKVVHGIKPGETGELTLTPDEEETLFQSGHLEPVEGEDGHSADPKEKVNKDAD